MTVATKLTALANTKEAIRSAINSKIITTDTSVPFSDYANRISNIDTLTGWARPSDWLPIPAPETGTQIFKGLLAVFPGEGNFVSVNAYSNYTVDWGDGTVENYNVAVKSNHTYDYSTISDTTLCSRGYKQVIVTITPQAGYNLTFVSAAAQTIWVNTSNSVNWLDISVNSPVMNALQIGSSSHRTPFLERCRVGQNIVTGWTSTFTACSSLVVCEIAWGPAPTLLTSTWSGCTVLPKFPDGLVTSSITSAQAAFSGCNSLQTLPTGFENCTNFTSFAATCTKIVEVTGIDVSKATTLNSAFYNMPGIRKLHLTANSIPASVDWVNVVLYDGSLVDLILTGAKHNISIINTKMSATSLNAFFSSLGDGTGRTVTITGARGAATCDRSIATAKGWTVVG